MMVVVPLFCGGVASSMILEYLICKGGSSRIWMMGGVEGEVNEVESRVCI
jgi:hypothetical protein